MTPRLIKATPKQLWAHLLCGSCEELFNRKGENPVQALLNGAGGFPLLNRMELALCTDIGSQGMTFAPCLVAESQFPMYSILVRGLWFHVVTTDSHPPGLDELCCVRSSKKVLFKEDCTERFLQAGRYIHQTAVVSPELRS